MTGDKKKLYAAFILHSMGYDVWLGNNRGNPYGRRHKSFATNSPSFWNYTYAEWFRIY